MLPSGTAGMLYEDQNYGNPVAISASGGSSGSYNFSMYPALVDGISIKGSNYGTINNVGACQLTGIPYATGSFPITISAADANNPGNGSSITYTLMVVPASWYVGQYWDRHFAGNGGLPRLPIPALINRPGRLLFSILGGSTMMGQTTGLNHTIRTMPQTV